MRLPHRQSDVIKYEKSLFYEIQKNPPPPLLYFLGSLTKYSGPWIYMIILWLDSRTKQKSLFDNNRKV